MPGDRPGRRELAARAGITEKALRVYEEEGLVDRGLDGYGPDALDRLRLIALLRDADVSIGSIQVLLAAHASGTRRPQEAATDLTTGLTDAILQVTTRIHDLTRTRDALIRLREALHHCRTCPAELDMCRSCEHARDRSTGPALVTLLTGER